MRTCLVRLGQVSLFTSNIGSSRLISGHGHGVAMIGRHDNQGLVDVDHGQGLLDGKVESHGLVHGGVGLEQVYNVLLGRNRDSQELTLISGKFNKTFLALLKMLSVYCRTS